jgi:predicted RNA binding protein YcfA (HicA-like mRNA interferase family)
VSKIEKLLLKVVSGSSDQNISFSDLILILTTIGFEFRVKGSHHIFFKEGVEEIINIQPNGDKAKPYQVKQVRNLLIKYKLIDL